MGTYHVYILYSQSYDRTYVGQTQDVPMRLERHQRRMVNSTRAFVPWVIVRQETFGSRSEAMRREKWYKTGIGRIEIDRILHKMGFRT